MRDASLQAQVPAQCIRTGNAAVGEIFISFTERFRYLLGVGFRKCTGEHLSDAALDLKPVSNRHLFDLVENFARAHVLIVTLAWRLFNYQRSASGAHPSRLVPPQRRAA
jgi:hypothetical protein